MLNWSADTFSKCLPERDANFLTGGLDKICKYLRINSRQRNLKWGQDKFGTCLRIYSRQKKWFTTTTRFAKVSEYIRGKKVQLRLRQKSKWRRSFSRQICLPAVKQFSELFQVIEEKLLLNCGNGNYWKCRATKSWQKVYLELRKLWIYLWLFSRQKSWIAAMTNFG